jgi:hypothetical protein
MQPDELARAIELWSQRVADDDDGLAWLRIAEAHHFAASVHAHDAAAALEHARAGMRAADRALDLLSAENVPALYWRARNQLTLAAAEGYAHSLLVDSEATHAMATCERLQPGYDHFGAAMWLARSSARPIDPAQRDLVAARARFDRVLAADADFLPHRVAMAEHYAIVAGDRHLFQSLLETVRDAVLSEPVAAEQQIAKTRAQQLLEQTDDLFE